jgi:hypothetical protein
MPGGICQPTALPRSAIGCKAKPIRAVPSLLD